MLEPKSQAPLALHDQDRLYRVDMAMKDLKDRLKWARKNAGSDITQLDLAKHLGVTPQAVSGWERGEATPETDKLKAIGEFLNVDINWLLGRNATVSSHPSEDASYVRKTTLETFPRSEIAGKVDLPVFATANGGKGALVLVSEPYTHIARPQNLLGIKEGYGVLIKGNSMAREYNENDVAFVDPIRHAKKDDACVFQGQAPDGTVTAIIKYLDRSPEASETLFYVYQTNPLKKFTLKKAEWQTCHVLVGKIAHS
jgi:transcriptional regulator with XRE-family HTH domain